MALLHGEYRESADINFLVSDRDGYRDLRQLLGGVASLDPIVRPEVRLELAREVRVDQYGIRTHVRSGATLIKFEIVFEGRIGLAPPAGTDRVCGLETLTPIDLAAEKLLANADRWRDDAVHHRDLIDLAMQALPRPALVQACRKAESAYGDSVRASLAAAVQHLRDHPDRLGECMGALSIHGISKAQLWQAIRRIERSLAPPRI